MKLIANASDAAVRRELWTSFRALLQAYLAAGSIGVEVTQALIVAGPETTDPLHATLDMLGVANTVKMAIDFQSGEGHWAVFGTASMANSFSGGENVPLDEGHLRLGMDSLFEWSGRQGRIEMDAIAEALVMLVLAPGS